MIRKQKVYEVGTLLSRRIFDEDTRDSHMADCPTENGIIIDRIRMKGRYPIEYRYVIQWDSGEEQRMRPKSLKGYVKSGYIEILSEG
tara:strand:- start:1739 stop:1999 length:261 start_codon:yes stop_codon:yes gene_type:complete